MKHTASSRFWTAYHALPEDIRSLADKNFELLKSNPRHPSLHFKRIGELWSAESVITIERLDLMCRVESIGSGSAHMLTMTR